MVDQCFFLDFYVFSKFIMMNVSNFFIMNIYHFYNLKETQHLLIA